MKNKICTGEINMSYIFNQQGKENLTDSIRDFIWKTKIEPAKKRGLDRITIRAGDIHMAMGLKDRMPAVCSALKTKIDKMYNIEILTINAPPSGQGANCFVTYKII